MAPTHAVGGGKTYSCGTPALSHPKTKRSWITVPLSGGIAAQVGQTKTA
jgi:hypothetical protein